MEQDSGVISQQQMPAPQPQRSSDVSFPQPPQKRQSSSVVKWIIGILGVVIILGAGGWFVYRSMNEAVEPSATPSVGGLSTFATPEPTSAPSLTPTPEPADKSEIKIEVLNGTGKAGEAGYLKGVLEKMGFEEVAAANADEQNETRTTVTFGSRVGDRIIDEITEKLEEEYEQVRTRKGDLEEYDIQIVTGLRKGGTSEEEETEATATPASSPTSSPTASPTPTSGSET